MNEPLTLGENPLSKHAPLKHKIAHLTSNVLNPFLICLGLIILFSFSSTDSLSEALKWAGISAGLGVMPVFVVVLYLLKNGKLDTFFINDRKQRTRIYILACLSATAGCITLACIGAPTILVAGFITGVSTAIIFTFINLWWKISLHTALVAASATVLVMLYGWIAAGTMAFVPLTAWSRIELRYHSLKQTVIGALLAVLLVVLLFQPLAML